MTGSGRPAERTEFFLGGRKNVFQRLDRGKEFFYKPRLFRRTAARRGRDGLFQGATPRMPG